MARESFTIELDETFILNPVNGILWISLSPLVSKHSVFEFLRRNFYGWIKGINF